MSIVFLLTLLLFILLGAAEEISKIKSVSLVLDEKIPRDSFSLKQNSYLFDMDGNVFSEFHSQQINRMYVDIEDIPQTLLDFFIVSEDRQFFEHHGIDGKGIARALLKNVVGGRISQGGSTITQQLARNLFLTHERTYSRKLSELLYTYQLERTLSKEEILELYLNAIYFGNGVYGAGAAADYYFGKPLSSLTLAEQALISSIPNNPSLYDPIENMTSVQNRKSLLLELMLKEGRISENDFTLAMAEQLQPHQKQKKDEFPDFSAYVMEELKQLVSERDGYTIALKEAEGDEKEKVQADLNKHIQKLIEKGVHIHTSLDPFLQRRAADSIHRHLANTDIQGAAVVADHYSHRIRAIIGGVHYTKGSFHRAYQAYRQPGSSIKPLLDYGPYIEETGAHANSMINADSFCSDDYCPKNFHDKGYGSVTLSRAFAHSYNTPAVRMLQSAGVEKSFQYLEKFGFSKLTKEDYRLPAAIGGFTYGMTPLEMTNAYTVFSNDGVYQPSRSIVKITSPAGEPLYAWEDSGIRVYSERTNGIIRELLSEAVKTGTGRKAGFPSEYIGGKTGTSNSYRDFWFIGATEEYTAGIWVGKDKGGSLEQEYAKSPHLTIWRDILQKDMQKEEM
ncbi:penicillin-binding protein [Bacillus lacus]|uniref:Penicillin-binding protein n=2 Tax=Metabacillus lacus TaxID=1983721 RepID=A0A7X2J1H3_9BACI|nr:penicillin-binding protein [Metabacillus lacus]